MIESRISESANLATWDFLKIIGFKDDSSVFCDDDVGLSIDFGNFKLSATKQLNVHLVKVIQMHGIMTTSRTISDVNFELHFYVESAQQLKALIVWNLDKYANSRKFIPINSAPWIEEGRANFDLLPWERQRLKYESRPRCRVDREWLKLAFNHLRNHTKENLIFNEISIDFDGKVLSFEVDDFFIPVTASGKPWDVKFKLPIDSISHLPKRIMHESVEISVIDNRLNIENRSFNGVVEFKLKLN